MAEGRDLAEFLLLEHWSPAAARSPGPGIGTQAQRLLTRYLFAHTPVVRVEADTETGNLAEQRALERSGFTREGVLRSVVFRDGQWRDVVRYSVLRDDIASASPTSDQPGARGRQPA
ncbi:GNAT family protein [Streptomyces sp. NPDC048550]|uniref:GNAT family N-acetyltransferase n=1 Tax=Streptomyces sp. NPDC048550 TaxID=3155739 RepID=UPI00342455BB